MFGKINSLFLYFYSIDCSCKWKLWMVLMRMPIVWFSTYQVKVVYCGVKPMFYVLNKFRNKLADEW